MPDEQPRKADSKPPERRFMLHYPAAASTLILRESDVMRVGVESQLKEVSATHITVSVGDAFADNERVQIDLTNEIQRFKKRTRGSVSQCDPLADGQHLVRIDLQLRLSPLEVILLKMGIARDQGTAAKWL